MEVDPFLDPSEEDVRRARKKVKVDMEANAEAWRKEPGETTEYEPPKDNSKPSSLGNAWEADEISGPGQVW